MKIANLTIMDDSNLGNRLQNYAVQKVLQKMGHDVTSLYYSLSEYRLFSKKGLTVAVHDFLLWSGIRSTVFYRKYIKKNKKLFRGLDFTKRYIKTTTRYLYKFKLHKMKKYADDYDRWCVGSDQIWNYGIVGKYRVRTLRHYLRWIYFAMESLVL